MLNLSVLSWTYYVVPWSHWPMCSQVALHVIYQSSQLRKDGVPSIWRLHIGSICDCPRWQTPLMHVSPAADFLTAQQALSWRVTRLSLQEYSMSRSYPLSHSLQARLTPCSSFTSACWLWPHVRLGVFSKASLLLSHLCPGTLTFESTHSFSFHWTS